MLGLALLRSATEEPPFTGLVNEIQAADETEFQWILEGGLGALLHYGSREGLESLDEGRRYALWISELSARVRGNALVRTAIDTIDTCAALRVTTMLLKGISTSDQLYPESHMRPMGDVDLLVPLLDRPRVEQALAERGYVPQPGYELAPDAWHGVPLRHPLHGAWVEIHSDLVHRTPPDATLGRDRAAHDSVPASYCGREVRRLRNELQILYASFAWMMDMARHPTMIHPSSLPPLIDLALLISRHGRSLDLEVLLERGDNELALGCAYTAVTYLARTCPWLVLHELESALRRRQRVATPLNVRATHAMLDQFLLGARPWAAWVPPPVTGRYSVRHQWRKRVAIATR